MGSSEEELKNRTEILLGKLDSVGFKINAKNYHFNKKSVIFLGHRLSEKGIGSDARRTEALAS